MNIKDLDDVNIKAFLYELNKEKEAINNNIDVLEKELELRAKINEKKEVKCDQKESKE